MRVKGWKAAALGTCAAVLATGTSPAETGHNYNDDDNAAVAIAAGITGLAIGVALASSSHRHYYDGYYYGRPYYPRYRYRYYERPYYYDYDRYYYPPPHRYYHGPRCWSRWVYDPYINRRVRVRTCR